MYFTIGLITVIIGWIMIFSFRSTREEIRNLVDDYFDNDGEIFLLAFLMTLISALAIVGWPAAFPVMVFYVILTKIKNGGE